MCRLDFRSPSDRIFTGKEHSSGRLLPLEYMLGQGKYILSIYIVQYIGTTIYFFPALVHVMGLHIGLLAVFVKYVLSSSTKSRNSADKRTVFVIHH